MGPIVCGIDFSPCSSQAMRIAARLAIQRDAELVLAHAWQLPQLAYGNALAISGEILTQIVADAEKALEAAAEDARTLGVTRVSTRLLESVPWAGLVQLAGEKHAQLVVVGSYGRTGVSRFLLGSVAEATARLAACSVLVVRGEPAAFANTVCAVDFSPYSKQAATDSTELCATNLTLLHVLEPESWLYNTAAIIEESKKSATNILEQWRRELAATTAANVASQVRVGRAAAQIVAAAEEMRCDLLVVGTHGRSGIARIALGSIAQKVVRHAPCSVLVSRAAKSTK